VGRAGAFDQACGGFESSWSAFARSSPFPEQGAFYNAINFDFAYSGPPNTTVTITPLSFLYCPSDPGNHIDDGSLGGTGDATTSYGTCDGDWYVWSVNWGATNSVGPRNRSMFGPNYSRRIAMVTDGLSNTLMASEGYIGHPQMRGCGDSSGPGSLPSDPATGTYSFNNIPLPGPNSAAALAYQIKNSALYVVEAASGRIMGEPLTSPRFPQLNGVGPKWEGMARDSEGAYSEDEANAFHGNVVWFVPDGETSQARKVATFEVAMKAEGLAILGVENDAQRTAVKLLITFDNDAKATKIPSRIQTATLIRESR
jgi:hypothetical protein